VSEDLVDRAHAGVGTNIMLLHDVKERDGVKLMPEQEQKPKAAQRPGQRPELDDILQCGPSRSGGSQLRINRGQRIRERLP
jgi:hypothetical protein